MRLLVNIDVDDMAKGAAFYERLGLRVGRRFDDDMIELLGAPVPIYLLYKPAGSRAAPGAEDVRRYKRHWTPVHFDIVVDDIGVAVAGANDAGATLEGDVETHSWGKLALMADPFGNGFCFLQFLRRGYDEIGT